MHCYPPRSPGYSIAKCLMKEKPFNAILVGSTAIINLRSRRLFNDLSNSFVNVISILYFEKLLLKPLSGRENIKSSIKGSKLL